VRPGHENQHKLQDCHCSRTSRIPIVPRSPLYAATVSKNLCICDGCANENRRHGVPSFVECGGERKPRLSFQSIRPSLAFAIREKVHDVAKYRWGVLSH
jgi:hypothetical protein